MQSRRRRGQQIKPNRLRETCCPSVGTEPSFRSHRPPLLQCVVSSSPHKTPAGKQFWLFFRTHIRHFSLGLKNVLRRVIRRWKNRVADSCRHRPWASAIAPVEAQVESRCGNQQQQQPLTQQLQQQQQRRDGVELLGLPAGAQDAPPETDDQGRIPQTQEHGAGRRRPITRLKGKK